jgi:ComF family protein
LPRLGAPFCCCCAQPFEGRLARDFDCPNCTRQSPAYDFARPALRRDPRALELIHRLKYGRQLHLGQELGRLAAEAFADPRLAQAKQEGWALVAVPLHRRRLGMRHFNQSAEIACCLARLTGLKQVAALRRRRGTGTQTTLGRKQRLANLRGAFGLTRAGRRMLDQGPAGVLLVDDVLTTGATADACARVLKQAGAKRVAVVAVLRG